LNRKRSSKLLGFLDGSPLYYKGERHLLLFGGSGLGKSTHYLVPNILPDPNSVICASDVAGELAMICGEGRQKHGKVWIDNPHRILPEALGPLPHGGCNPMDSLDEPDSLKFGIKAMKIAAGCVVKDPSARDKFWQNTARSALKAVIMAEARRGEFPNLARVAEIVHGDFFEYARQVCAASASLEIKQTLKRFTTAREDEVKSLKEVVEQMRTDTDFLIDQGIAENVTRQDFKYADCRKEVASIFSILGIDVIDVLDKYLRLQLATCLSDLINPDVEGDVPVTIYCDEYGLVARGGLDAMSAAFIGARKFNVTLFFSVTNLQELQTLHPHDWEGLIANAGATIWMCPITDQTTAEYLSKKCGEKDVYTHSLTSSDKKRETGGSFSHAGRRVFTPAELAGMNEDEAIVFTDFSKGRPIVVKHRSYQKMPELRAIAGKNTYYER
jgi:type IV secretion system protein VirD4